MLTKAEAKMRAAAAALAAVQSFGSRRFGFAELEGEDLSAVRAELARIEDVLRKQATGGDRILGRQLGKELGRQVKPPRGQQRQLEALAKKLGGGKP